jgi:hypothetical protein
MAVLKSIATGNFLNASTWGLVNPTSYSNTEAASTLLTTSYVTSSTFTPGAITISGICIKLTNRAASPSGTISVSLNQGGSTVAGTEVTINVADLPLAVAVSLNGGWIFFKFAANVTLLAATAYSVQAKTSVASQVTIFRNATAGNWDRALVTTTTQAPAAGDDLIVAGEFTGTGANAEIVVTMNNINSATDYGAASNSLITPAIAICSKGELTFGIAAATNYYLKVSGNVIVYGGGKFYMGELGAECPRDSTMTLHFDIVTTVEYGLTVRDLGTFEKRGLSRTVSKEIVSCLLNTDEAIGQTTLGVNTDTGWLSGDEIAIAPTTRTSTQHERRTLNANAGASSLSVSVGLTNAHTGSGNLQADVINITRNVRIRGTSTTLNAYVVFRELAQVYCKWSEFFFLGSNTTLKRGVEIYTTTGSCVLETCSFRDFTIAGSGISVVGGSSNNYQLLNCVSYNMVVSFTNTTTSGTAWIINGFIAIGNIAGSTANAINITDVGGSISNITVAGGSGTTAGLTINEANYLTGTINGIRVYSCNAKGIQISNLINGLVENLKAFRNNSYGIELSNIFGTKFNQIDCIGNVTVNIGLTAAHKDSRIVNARLNSETTYTTDSGVRVLTPSGGNLNLEDCELGVVSGTKLAHNSSDIQASSTSALDLFLYNCRLNTSLEVGSQSSMSPKNCIYSQKHDQVAGSHKTWKGEGTISIDTSISDASPSVRMQPNSASRKLESVCFMAPVNSGDTLSVSVKVRESVVGDGTDYNGNRARLILKRNPAAGITDDVVLATASASSVGAWEVLNGTTPTVSDDAVLTFAIDCDGTTGWINYDTWTITSQNETKGLKYWLDGEAVAFGDNSAGGGGGGSVGGAYVHSIFGL